MFADDPEIADLKGKSRRYFHPDPEAALKGLPIDKDKVKDKEKAKQDLYEEKKKAIVDKMDRR